MDGFGHSPSLIAMPEPVHLAVRCGGVGLETERLTCAFRQ
jgi:hypothetical protein